MVKFLLKLYLLCCFLVSFQSNAQKNYLDYHSTIIECEQLIVNGQSAEAIETLDSLFKQFDFVFIRDIRMAVELSAYEKDYVSSFKFVRLGIKAGWTLKSIKKSKNLQLLTDHPEWVNIESEYDSLRKIFVSRIDLELRKQVHEMMKKDQKKALGALFRIGQKAQDNYSEKKFAPQNEKQLLMIDAMLDQYGYPGERLIGNSVWTAVILSHHNSISYDYVLKDTLYTHLRPKLTKALQRGEISPNELAQIEDWKTAALSSHGSTSYGFLGKIPSETELQLVNRNRAEIGLRSVELRNKLIDIEKSSGLNLYLPKGWQKGKITVSKSQ